jgi:hypothetical protein
MPPLAGGLAQASRTRPGRRSRPTDQEPGQSGSSRRPLAASRCPVARYSNTRSNDNARQTRHSADWRNRQPCKAGEAISSMTLDVKVPVWITRRSGAPCPRPKKSCVHSRCMMFSQFTAMLQMVARCYPQACPQPAHSASGVSAHAVHRPVHSMSGRFNRVAEDCPKRSIEQA